VGGLGFEGEGSADRVFEVGHLLEATDGEVVLFDVVLDRLDPARRGCWASSPRWRSRAPWKVIGAHISW